MFNQEEIGFYGFSHNGKHILDEFRSLLRHPRLSMRGLLEFELIILQQEIAVTFRRAANTVQTDLPWCHFWGDCDISRPFTTLDERSGKYIEQLTFCTKPFQLIKHFFSCCDRPSPAAAVLVCLPDALANRLHDVLLEHDYEKRLMLSDVFLLELEHELLESPVSNSCSTSLPATITRVLM